jgi:hypothetical protein
MNVYKNEWINDAILTLNDRNKLYIIYTYLILLLINVLC